MNNIPTEDFYSESEYGSFNGSYDFNITSFNEPSAVEVWLHFVIFTIIFVIGIPANTVVIIVLIFSRTKGFSVTSIYIINMAVVDLMLLCAQAPMKLKEIVISQTSNEYELIWEPSVWGCRFQLGTVYVNMTVSIFTLMALSFSRYCAVMHPVGARADM
ncbi:P2Y purinoceptor 3 [Holothuria leucospilota]|uniref:P2Y purinoceptor 3 n=1 Tax=Holothuria leucospilota TaxID=206669 RepID=A0A9Q1H9C2_HOLLE|nr:P2Y purinoceptor 3 [Holothuria leucospilota]